MENNKPIITSSSQTPSTKQTPPDTVELSEEEKELTTDEKQVEAVEKRFRETPKFTEWVRLFTEKSNKETFGNQTQSAIQSYGLDPEKQYHVAGQIGYENMRKLEILASMHYAKQGITAGTLLDIAAARMYESKSPVWWDRVAELMGVRNQQTGILINNQNNIQANIDVNDEQKQDFNQAFKLFVESS